MTSTLENLTLDSAADVDAEDDVVDPWNVCGKSKTGIDYDKLISKADRFQMLLFFPPSRFLIIV